MQDNYTHISILVDRSGSMSSVRDDAEGAINAYIREQKLVEGDCSLRLADFDAPGDADWYRSVYDGPIGHAPHYELRPRGNTALLDAVALMINATGDFLSAIPEVDRPARVIVVIQTDGQENSSTEHSWDDVKAMIDRQTNEFNWQFLFLGMGLGVSKQGAKMGVRNVVAGAATGASHQNTMSAASSYTTQYRGGQTKDMSAMAGVSVTASGAVYDKDGNEIDPKTGKPVQVKVT